MRFSSISIPKPLRKIGEFNADNPWNQGKPERWSLEEFLMINAAQAHHFRLQENSSKSFYKWMWGAYEVIGIRSSLDQRYHILPASLTKLWKDKKITPEELPKTLHQIEPQLKKIDFCLNIEGWGYKLLGLFFSLFVVSLACFLLFFSYTTYVFPDNASAHRVFRWPTETSDIVTLSACVLSLGVPLIFPFKISRFRRRARAQAQIALQFLRRVA